MSRRWFLIVPVFLVTFLLLQNWIVFKTLEWSLNKTFQEAYSEKLTWDALERKGSTLFIKGLKVGSGSSVPFRVEEASLWWDIQFFSPTLTLDVKLKHPEIDITEKKVDLVKIFEDVAFPWLQVKGSLEMEGGILKHSKGQSSFDMAFKSHAEDKLKLSLDDRLEVSFKQNGKEKEGRVNAREFSLPLLEEIKAAFVPRLFDERILNGVLNGKAALYFSSVLAPQIEGDFKLYDLLVEDPLDRLFFSAKGISFDLNPASPLPLSEDLPWLPSLSGKVSVLKGERFSWGQNPERRFQAEDFDGTILFGDFHKVAFESRGEETFHDMRRPYHIKGSLDLNNLSEIRLELDYVGDSKKDHSPKLKLLGTHLGSRDGVLDLDIKNFGIQQFTLIENISKKLAPKWFPVQFLSGKVDAKVELGFEKTNLTHAAFKELQLRNVSCLSDEWGCDFGAQTLAGFIALDFRGKEPSKSLNGELLVVKGFLNLKSLSETLWNFNDIETKVVVKDGVIEQSTALASLAGLSGKVEIDWYSKKQPLSMRFSGKGSDLAPFMPDRIASGIERRLKKDEIELTLNMHPRGGSMQFEGALNLKDPEAGLLTSVQYGFDLVAPSSPSEASFKEFLYWFKEAPEELPEFLAPFGQGLASALIAHKQSETGVFGFRLQDGWLKGRGIFLDKYLSAFLFKKDDIVLKGSADISGIFDLKGLELSYTAQNLVLESGKFRMEMPYIPGHRDGVLEGSHRVDFTSGEHRGQMPLEEANYYDKVKGLFFDRVRGKAMFHEKKVFLEEIESFLNGIYLKGRLLVDNTDDREGFFDLYAHLDTLNGSLEAASRSLKRVDPDLLLLEIPLNGQLWLKDEGADLTLNVFQDEFYRDEFHWDAKINGALVDGTLEIPFLKSEADGVNLSFLYDKGKDELTLSDFGGSFLVGKSGQEQEVGFLLEGLSFKSLENKEGAFHFTLFDKQGDVLALKGEIEADDEGKLSFLFDQDTSHFNEAPFKKVELETEGFSRLIKAHLDFGMDLKPLADKLEQFYPDLKSISEKAKGKFKTTLTYDESDSRLYFVMNGEKVSLFGQTFEKALLEGQFLEGVFSIHNGVFDDFVFSVDLKRSENHWDLKHLGIKIKDSILLGAEGVWEEGSDTFKADLSFLEIVLNKLDGFDEMKPFVEEFQPKGRLKGEGEVILSFKEGTPDIQALLKTQSKGVEFNGLRFKNLEPSLMTFEMGKGVKLSGVKSALIDPDTLESLIDFDIKEIGINFKTEETEVEDLRYSAPAKTLPKLADTLQKAFPELVTPFVKQSVSTLKTDGQAVGTMGLKAGDNQTTFKATLADGKWRFLGVDSELKQFSLELDPDEVKLTTQYLVEDTPVWVLARTPRPGYDTGVVLIAESGLDEAPVTLHWEYREQEGLVVKKAQGSVLGLSFNLKEDPQIPTSAMTHRFVGEIGIDPSRASILLSSEMRQKIDALGLKEGWALRGRLEIQKEAIETKRPYTFEGDLLGSDFVAYNHRFEKLYSKLSFTEEEAHLQELVLEDPFGTLYVEQGHFGKDASDIWHINIPLIVGYDLRPCLMWENGKKKPTTKKPLCVKEFQIQDLQGPLTPLSELHGKGVLSFVNPPKKHLANTIFALPSEIVSRIGIDMAALTPVSGTVMFEISDEKVWFTKFKDVISDQKLSKFYLADQKTPSHMGFGGDLHMVIKMRQNTLLLKLAEFLTFNIEGTIQKPQYSLNKEKR